VISISGRTLYHLAPESSHHILCAGRCVSLWSPVQARSHHTQLKAGAGVGGHLSVVHRPDGRSQVAFDGMPLYTFARDHRAGDVNGQGFAHVWFVVGLRRTPGAGNPIPQHNGGDR